MVDRWESRVEPKPDQGKLYWHILLAEYPEVQALASAAQERLAPFTGLHFTPQRWLHITTLMVGLMESFTPEEVRNIRTSVRETLSKVAPVNVVPGKVLYHPEAIAIGLSPEGSLNPIRSAIRQATCKAIGDERILDSQLWNPHFTIAYSTAIQSAAPIIAALGKEFLCSEILINNLSLVVQEGAERLWNWRVIDEIALEG
jgi:2'-5' RNA ligase